MSDPVYHNQTDTRFAAGNPGKPPGARFRNRDTWKTLEELGFDPIHEAVRRYRDETTPHASKDYCLGLITDRLLPKLKAVEVSGANGQSLSQVLINVIAGETAQTLDHSVATPLTTDIIPQLADDAQTVPPNE